MKISFIKDSEKLLNGKSNDGKNSTIIILTEEDVKKSKSQQVKFAKENFNFAGKSGEIHQVPEANKILIIAGAGEEKKLNELEFQKIGGKIFDFANALKLKNADIFFANKSDEDIANVAFGAFLKSYRFNKYFENKKEGKGVKVNEFSFACQNIKEAKRIYQPLAILADNICFARDLVSEPSNELNPESYAKICKSLTKEGLKVTILGEKEMSKLGMNSLLAVGKGSNYESKLVILEWNGGKKGEAPLAFVGKGVTFDTGGISIKPSANMEDMKTDMGGSAAVVGLLRNLAQRKAKTNVIGVVGLVENMPSSTAQKPGDVVTSMSGQTIEVINTDAEGRMVLADALHYTNVTFKPKFIVDLATLTGAVIVSLADVYAGLFSNDDKLAKEIEESGNITGERVWRLPIGEEYDQMINSDIADMKNVGSGRGAGSTTAAQFLHRFIGKTKWVHLDIAGVAWKGKGDPMAVKGASGFGVKLLNDLVIKHENS